MLTNEWHKCEKPRSRAVEMDNLARVWCQKGMKISWDTRVNKPQDQETITYIWSGFGDKMMTKQGEETALKLI